MTEQTAYKLHLEQAQAVAQVLPVQVYDLAKYAFAVNKIENRSFYEKAKNPNSTARGMMQMLIGTQKELETKYLKVKHNPDKIFQPAYSIYLGQYELARQLKRYSGNWRKAIHAYNRGSYQANKANTPGFASGENYANSVLSALQKTDYAALNNATGYDVVAANTSGTSTTSLRREWT
ncbi:MAG: transglycosylase SLT domain-containing protein [Candidatus Kapaibacterium sp.]